MNRPSIAVLLTVCLGAAFTAVADDRTDTLDLMAAPASPAFVLLDAAPEAIDRPGSVTDFKVSLQNATNDFSTLPDNYAVSFAPYWIFGGDDLKYDAYAAGRKPMLRTTSISLATTAEDDTLGNRVRSLGAGLRLTLVQGAIDTEYEGYQKIIDSLRDDLADLNTIVNDQTFDRLDNDESYKALNAMEDDLRDQRQAVVAERGADDPQVAMFDAQIEINERLKNERFNALHAEIMTSLRTEKEAKIADMQSRARSLRIRRLGFNLDLAGGAAWTFPDQEWDQGRLRKAGAWLTAAYEGRDLSGYLVGRWLHDDLMDLQNIDVGLRLTTTQGRFAFSGEAVYRNSSEEEIIDSSWRYDLVLDYQFAANKKVGLTFGKDFDGNPDGNVLAILNLVLGFGSERPVSD